MMGGQWWVVNGTGVVVSDGVVNCGVFSSGVLSGGVGGWWCGE